MLTGKIIISIGFSVIINSKCGRFPFNCRWNKDEVPGTFGEIARIVSVRGERSTITRVIEGWGDRICTLVINIGPEGLQLPVGVVFKGAGLKLKEEEWESYRSKKNIFVCFQEKAWVDTKTELKLIEGMIKPAVTRLRNVYAAKGENFPGVILIEDNFKPHFAEYSSIFYLSNVDGNFLVIRSVVKALHKLDVFPIALPSLVTDVAQTVGDNNGKTLGQDLNREFQSFLQDFDWVTYPNG